MATKHVAVVGLAALLALAAAGAAHADDTDLLNRATPLPNVLIILDTSQSMTWYQADGSTRGDEYQGWSGDGTPMARMAMAKSVLSSVVTTFFDKLRLGLASYAEGGTSANPNLNVGIAQYWYYYDNRTYVSIDPGTAASPLRLWVDGTNINMPSQNTFTLNWALDPGVVPNPLQSVYSWADVTYCIWNVVETDYNPDGSIAWGPTTSTETQGTAPCPARGTTGTVTQMESFSQRVSGDDPNPYKYNVTQSWTGYAVYALPCPTGSPCPAAYNRNFGAAWTDYRKVYTYDGATAFSPGGTTYSWTYYYKGTCTSGCSGYLTDSATVWQATPTPVPPSPWSVPFSRVYTWSGNNYQMTTAETSCAVGAGITVLVDVGGAPDQNTLKNFLGTGTDRRKELHGANFYTPLAAGLDTVRQYFLNPTGTVQTDPQKNCRHNYVILVTDGGESCPLVPLTGPGSPGSKAAALLAAPINAFGGAPTYVVGLDAGTLSPDEQQVLADIAARGSPSGTGTYYSASTPDGLLNALNAIIGSILSNQYSFVNEVVPTLRAADNLMLIQGSFVTPSAPPANPNTPRWQGVLKAFPLTSQGTVSTTAERISATPLWEAGAVLAGRAGSSRAIKTVVGGAQVDFLSTPGLQAALNVTLDVNGDGVVNAADADQVISVVRGANAGNLGFLGDIFHSVPILVGPPSPTYVDRTFDPASPSQLLSLAAAPDTFVAFRGTRNTRPRLVLVGANDGMLHAFNAGTFASGQYNTGNGSEVWAFIPPQLLPKLQYLAVNLGHQYFVDGPARVADVWLDLNNDGVKAPDGSEWRTVLVGGFRQGGTGLYALDITDTTNPQFLWTYATTGQSWSEPAFGKVKVKIGGRLVDRWVVFAGDGYDPTGTNGRMIHVIDLQTGKALWQFPTTAPVAASPITIDLSNKGYVERVYVGTVGGDLLRLDVSAVGQAAGGASVDPTNGVLVATCPAGAPTCWSGSVFFSAGTAQPFYTKVAATVDAQGNLWIFAGSGDRSNPLLMPATPNRAYGIKDPYPAVTRALTEADLTNMTSTNTLDATAVGGFGWYLVFRPGEKEFAEVALVFNRQVFFTSFMPGSTGCGDVGAGSLYMVYYLTGGGVTNTALFQANPPQASSRIYQVNAGVTMRPVITTGTQGTNAVLYLSNSTGLTITPSFSIPSSIRSVQYFRQVLP